MIYFECPDCETRYPAQIAIKGITYLYDNLRVVVTSNEESCLSCKEEIAPRVKQAEEEARKALREKKKHANTAAN